MLLAMFNLAHIAEKYFTSRSIVDVKELKDNHPDFALVLEVDDNCLPQFSNLNYKKIPVCDLEVGSNILVRAGETVAVDGEVIQGASTITIEHLTAESEPREKAGGYNSRWCKKPWRNADCQVSRGSIYRALGLMVAASPCALAVAPLAYATAISSCASKGILLKGGHVLDAVSACQTIAFDKTGTLITGKLMCKAIEPILGHLEQGVQSCCSPYCEKEALAVVAAMEKGTTQPIGVKKS